MSFKEKSAMPAARPSPITTKFVASNFRCWPSRRKPNRQTKNSRRPFLIGILFLAADMNAEPRAGQVSEVMVQAVCKVVGIVGDIGVAVAEFHRLIEESEFLVSFLFGGADGKTVA